MALPLLIEIVLLIVVLGGIFSSWVNPVYGRVGGFVAAVAALLLFLIAVGVIHL